MKIHPGIGANVRKFGTAYIVGAKRDALTFAPAFALNYFGDYFEVGYGTVNDREPTIGGQPISGIDAEGKVIATPRVPVGEAADTEARIWVCVQVTVNDDGRIAARQDAVTVVAVRDPARLQEQRGNVGLHPIGLLRANEEVWQIAYFNLRHAVTRPRTGTGWRHFFWSA